MKMKIPSDDEISKMAAKVIMKTEGIDYLSALERARANLVDRRHRRASEAELLEQTARRLWNRLAGSKQCQQGR